MPSWSYSSKSDAECVLASLNPRNSRRRVSLVFHPRGARPTRVLNHPPDQTTDRIAERWGRQALWVADHPDQEFRTALTSFNPFQGKDDPAQSATLNSAINTILALCGATLITYVASSALRKGKLSIADMANAALAGGVAVGASCNTISAPGAFGVGLLAGGDLHDAAPVRVASQVSGYRQRGRGFPHAARAVENERCRNRRLDELPEGIDGKGERGRVWLPVSKQPP